MTPALSELDGVQDKQLPVSQRKTFVGSALVFQRLASPEYVGTACISPVTQKRCSPALKLGWK